MSCLQGVGEHNEMELGVGMGLVRFVILKGGAQVVYASPGVAILAHGIDSFNGSSLASLHKCENWRISAGSDG